MRRWDAGEPTTFGALRALRLLRSRFEGVRDALEGRVRPRVALVSRGVPVVRNQRVFGDRDLSGQVSSACTLKGKVVLGCEFFVPRDV